MRDLNSSVPHFQYHHICYVFQGNVISRKEADNIREGEHGKRLASHFATPSTKGMVINGFAIYKPPLPEPGTVSGTPISRYDIVGRGGGSFCNHSSTPNAKFMASYDDDGLGLFIVSTRQINQGEFINVEYGKGFRSSKKSNL